MNIGKMDRRITIQRSSLGARDSVVGSPVVTWSDLHIVWCSVVPVSGTEALRMERQISTEISRFFIRYREGITVKDRISYSGKHWDILNIRELGRKEGIEITAEARE